MNEKKKFHKRLNDKVKNYHKKIKGVRSWRGNLYIDTEETYGVTEEQRKENKKHLPNWMKEKTR